MEIPINVIGTIINSEHPGHHLRVVDDSEESGGFFILNWWPGPDEKKAEHGFDDWVQDRAELEQYFLESEWAILWPA